MSAVLDELASLKSQFNPAAAGQVAELLRRLQRARFDAPGDLVRLHEIVLFLRAYPHSPETLRLADQVLASFAERLDGQDADSFDEPEISGMAGTAVSSNFSFEIARGLAARYRQSLHIDWDNYPHPERLGAALARAFPMAAEQWTVEPNVDWRAWFTSSGLTLAWLLGHLDPLTYDLLEIPLCWDLGNSPASRTAARLPFRRAFCHTGPLLRRSDVSLDAELAAAPVPVVKLAPARARTILNRIADSSAARYRELWGFTHPDAAHVYHAALGRGTDFFFFGVPKAFRLPLRAYHCGMFVKNGVPMGYVETLSLFERAEVGFNLYYTFREGETAWLYARMLKVLHEHLGVTAFSIDPYQIGHDNEEAIASGAFWFYRKLGFRPASAGVLRLTQREERRIIATPGYRTPAPVLRRLAHAPLIYGPPEADAWGEFSLERLAQRAGAQIVPGFDRDSLVRAKNAPEERSYLRLLQHDPDLRRRVVTWGAKPGSGRGKRSSISIKPAPRPADNLGHDGTPSR
ncbi:MAG TPA: hypothetical protein VN841_06875 [Bryobacteraceae bacterium]|nr:hypothetical protein [Bryobacteraceae bacterium]